MQSLAEVCTLASVPVVVSIQSVHTVCQCARSSSCCILVADQVLLGCCCCRFVSQCLTPVSCEFRPTVVIVFSSVQFTAAFTVCIYTAALSPSSVAALTALLFTSHRLIGSVSLFRWWVYARDAKEPEPSKNESNQNPGLAQHWTEPEWKFWVLSHLYTVSHNYQTPLAPNGKTSAYVDQFS